MTQRNFRVRNGLTLDGTTSGEVNIAAPAVAGTQSYTLPTGLPASNGYVLASQTDGTMSWIDNSAAGTTYNISSSTTTGGANFNLNGSDSSVDTIKFANGTNVTVTSTDANTITIAATDTNTTYDFNASSTTGGANLNLVGSDSTTDTVKLTNNGHITATYTSATEVTLGSDATDANTASTIVSRDGSGDFSAGSITLTGDIAVNGGDITTTSTGTATIFNTNATTVNLAGAATTVSIGANTGTTTINNNLTTTGNATVGSTAADRTLTINGNTTTIATTGITSTAQDFTITHGGGSLVPVNSYILLSGVTPSGYNGIWRANAVSAGSITVVSNANLGTASVQGTIAYGASILATPTVNRLTIGSSTPSINIGSGAQANGQPSAINTNGNVFNTSFNFVVGQIRDYTTSNSGDSWSMLSGAANIQRGLSIDNTFSSTKRPGIVLRGINAQRGMIVSEVNRGSTASPLAVNANTNLLEIAGSGYNGTQYVTDAITVAPISISLQSAEAFTSPAGVNTANGARLRVDAQPTGVTATAVSRSAIINHIPTTATYRADAWTFATREVAAGGTNTTQFTLDSSGNATVTGDLAVNGADITTTSAGTATVFNTNATTLNLGQAATTISMGAVSTTGSTQVRNNLAVRSGLTYDMLSTTSVGNSNQLSINKTDATSSSQFGLINYNTYRSSGGVYTPTQSGDVLGQFKFNGNAFDTTALANVQITGTAGQFSCNATTLGVGEFVVISGTLSGTGTITGYTNPKTYKISATNGTTTFTLQDGATPIVTTAGTTTGLTFTPQPGAALSPGGLVQVQATETWTPTANGSLLNFSVIKTGSTSASSVISISPNSATFKSDSYTFQDSAGVNVVGSSNITYNRVYGQWQYNTTVTPAAANTSYVFPLGTADVNNIATVASTSRLIPGAAGAYNLQFSVQWDNSDNQEHIAYIWLRKNGVNVAGSMGQVTLLKQSDGIASWNYVVNSANTTDYFEIAYQVTNTAVTFPYIAGFGTAPDDVPAAASIITSLTPVGA